MLNSICSVFAYDKGNGIEVLMGYDVEDDKVYMITSDVAIKGYEARHDKINELVTYPYAPWWFVPSYESDGELWEAIVLKREKRLPYLSSRALDKVGQIIGAYQVYKEDVLDALRKLGVREEDLEELLK